MIDFLPVSEREHVEYVCVQEGCGMSVNVKGKRSLEINDHEQSNQVRK